MWDIGLVLRALSLETASLEAITYKAFVVTALALGARRGELCAFVASSFVLLRPHTYSIPYALRAVQTARHPTLFA